MKTTKVHFNPAHYITGKAAVDIDAGTVVMVAKTLEDRNPVIKPAVAGKFPIGVVAHDVKKDEAVMVYRSGHVLDVKAAADVTEGEPVTTDAAGKVKKSTDWANPIVGVALTAHKNGFATIALA